MADNDKINELVAALVRDRFPEAEILSVDVVEDRDFDDDTILRVRVVFEAESDMLDSSATSSFLRYLRPRLSDIGVRSFPVMSFISRKDAGVAA